MSLNERWLRPGSILVIFMFLCGGCVSWTQFRPAESELPITMFGRYDLNIGGNLGWHDITYVDIRYLTKICDTMNTDTIPILLIDSMCFLGSCFDSPFCFRPTTWARIRDSVYYANHGENPWVPFRDSDLFYYDQQIIPGGYRLEDAYSLPESCRHSVVSIELYARLLERPSHKELSRETKRLRLRFKDRSQIPWD